MSEPPTDSEETARVSGDSFKVSEESAQFRRSNFFEAGRMKSLWVAGDMEQQTLSGQIAFGRDILRPSHSFDSLGSFYTQSGQQEFLGARGLYKVHIFLSLSLFTTRQGSKFLGEL